LKSDALNIIYMPISFSHAQKMLYVPLKFGCHIVPWFVTPRGIWPQHDQTNPFSHYMRGKSELLIIMTF